MFGGGGALVAEKGGKGGFGPPGGAGPLKLGGPLKFGGIMPGPAGGNGGTIPSYFC